MPFLLAVLAGKQFQFWDTEISCAQPERSANLVFSLCLEPEASAAPPPTRGKAVPLHSCALSLPASSCGNSRGPWLARSYQMTSTAKHRLRIQEEECRERSSLAGDPGHAQPKPGPETQSFHAVVTLRAQRTAACESNKHAPLSLGARKVKERFYEIVDHLVNEIKRRFDEAGMKKLIKLEMPFCLLSDKALHRQELQLELGVHSFDINIDLLNAQLLMLKTVIPEEISVELSRRSDEALEVGASVARIAPSGLLTLDAGVHPTLKQLLASHQGWTVVFFSVIFRFPPHLHSGSATYSPCFTFISSQNLDVKSRPNPFILSTFVTSRVPTLLKIYLYARYVLFRCCDTSVLFTVVGGHVGDVRGSVLVSAMLVPGLLRSGMVVSGRQSRGNRVFGKCYIDRGGGEGDDCSPGVIPDFLCVLADTAYLLLPTPLALPQTSRDDSIHPAHCLPLLSCFAFPRPGPRHCSSAVVAERLACSPPTKANRVHIPARVTPGFSQVGIVPDDVTGRAGFSRGSPVPPPPLYFSAALILTSFHPHLLSRLRC
ncbi:hypothetical protein PR048_003769 [Dryococelus australis]|uniref:Uncharacterized protein n=1 Tax=Dryococelus australis TaxID=614101 RepID=A0ABQ9INY1_9NEOP|nr:hypothetical protein PR048_003769 [Dryococelus australis]